MKANFDHEKLSVDQEAIRFVVWVGDLLETLPRSLVCAEQGKEMLVPIVSMLVGLIRSTSADRIHEERAEYATDNRRFVD